MAEENLTNADNKDQERTRLKKQEFLIAFKRTRGVITACCEKLDMSRETFYEWKRNDPDFAQRLREVEATRDEEVEDILMGLIHLQKDPASVRYYLDRRSPKYKPKSKVESVISGNITLEDLLRSDARNKIDHAKGTDGAGAGGGDAGQPDADRGAGEAKG